jgi:tRNA threonylcarbamoyladenosine biosynthesis protein TsaE
VAATEAVGRALARAWSSTPGSLFVALEGELGTGKTTLARGFLREAGVTGPVRSPTFTLIEVYPLTDGRLVQHLDWYRIAGQDDVEGLGFRDLLNPGAVCLVEWASHVPAIAAHADLEITLALDPGGRRLTVRAATPRGAQLLQQP